MHYYLFKKKSGSVNLHDKEYDKAKWFTFSDALKTASFKNDKLMIKRALKVIRRRQDRAKKGKGPTPTERFEADEETVRFIKRKRRAHDPL